MNVVLRQAVRRWLISLHILGVMLEESKKQLIIRRWWTKPHLHIRENYGGYHTIFLIFKLENHEGFKNFMGMTVGQFNYLYELVSPQLRKSSLRKSLPPELRLAIVINHLVHGSNVTNASLLFRVGKSSYYKIIPEICTVLYTALRRDYLRVPQNADEWLSIATNFYNLWNFPHYLGAIDGTHIRIKAPPHSGSKHFNYKKFFSIVLMGLCDAYQHFIWIYLGDFGNLNDAGIFQWSDLGRLLEAHLIQWPNPTPLSGTEIIFPFSIVGDAGFALKPYLMKPFAKSNNYGNRQKIFNYRLSRARRIIECAFGTLQKKWKVLDQRLGWKLETTEIVILAIIAMHNFLITYEMSSGKSRYVQSDDANVLNDIADEVNEEGVIDDLDDAVQMKNILSDYFMSAVGAVSWQAEYAMLV